jgi:hypothetical protein
MTKEIICGINGVIAAILSTKRETINEPFLQPQFTLTATLECLSIE